MSKPIQLTTFSHILFKVFLCNQEISRFAVTMWTGVNGHDVRVLARIYKLGAHNCQL